MRQYIELMGARIDMNMPEFKGVLAEKEISRKNLALCRYESTHFIQKVVFGGDTFSVGEIRKIVKALSLTNEETINIF